MSRKLVKLAHTIAMALTLSAALDFTGCKSTQHSVTLSWQVVAPVNNVPIRGYNVYRGENPGGPYKLIASQVPGATYKDSKVSSTKTYYYVVTTIDQSGNESKHSEEIKATVP